MSRNWFNDRVPGVTQETSGGYAMWCDTCWCRCGPRKDTLDFPYIEFADLGWQSNSYGDRCPECIASKGPLDEPYDRETLRSHYDDDLRLCVKYRKRLPNSPAVEAYGIPMDLDMTGIEIKPCNSSSDVTGGEGRCGEILDHFPEVPGKVVSVCEREPHSTRAWHSTADGNTKWRQKKPRKQ